MEGAVRVSKYFDMHGSVAHDLSVDPDACARRRRVNQDIISHGVVGPGFRARRKRGSTTGQKKRQPPGWRQGKSQLSCV